MTKRITINSDIGLMTEEVRWPKAWEGGRVVGREDIRDYWTRQWRESDPHVEPLTIIHASAQMLIAA